MWFEEGSLCAQKAQSTESTIRLVKQALIIHSGLIQLIQDRAKGNKVVLRGWLSERVSNFVSLFTLTDRMLRWAGHILNKCIFSDVIPFP